MQRYITGTLPRGLAWPGLRVKLRGLALSALVALVLSLSAGIVVVGVLFTASGAAVAGAGVAYGSCQQIESDLAASLGLDAATLRASDPAATSARLAERQASGQLTAREVARAAGWATTYADCRLVLGRAIEASATR